MKLFNIIKPKAVKVPIIISSPHSGTYFPESIAEKFRPEMIEKPDDTDWFIDKLYDFASDLGITMISANYSRWVIDLNRDPASKPLYDDGRVITGLCPTTNFNGDPLYRNETPDEAEIDFRIKNWYRPYHDKIGELLEETKQQLGKALLFDAHSIRKVVPGIQKDPFPDLILGDNDGATASEALINATLGVLNKSKKTVEHNHPFKGGYITRSFGNPTENIHALQLEMAKTNYMDNSETQYHNERAEETRENLKQLFQELITILK